MAERAGSEYPPPDSKPHRGWHQPHDLPHSDFPLIVQLLTFRLADTLPAHISDHNETPGQMRHWVERDLDRGSGACCPARPEVTDLVQSALLVFEDQRYRLRAWCILLNHVHVPFEASGGLASGGYRKIMEEPRRRRGESEYRAFGAILAARLFWPVFDQYMCDEDQMARTIDCIERNLVQASMCSQPSSRRWSSVSRKVGVGSSDPATGAAPL